MRKGLGKGLSALVEESSVVSSPVDVRPEAIRGSDIDRGVLFVSVDVILPSRYQPRKEFDEAILEELAESIRQHGVIQPLIVSDLGNGSYELCAGERRLRASRLAGLENIPVVIREFKEKDKLAIALIENVQRTDLNAIELAEAYKEMMDRLNLTQEQVSQSVGKSRASIANVLRLLKLPETVRKMIVSENLSEGHGRALLPLNDLQLIEDVAKMIDEKDLTVRETEEYVRKYHLNKNDLKIFADNQGHQKNEKMSALEERLVKTLGVKTVVSGNKDKGFVKLFYHTSEDLEIILKHLIKEK
ncbi:MAG: ParB/RepB/Spo0J family partition protein [Brevinema sp.]